MKKIIDVHTGKVKTGRKNAILKSSGIGSCVAIAAYNSARKVGVMAHVMLPGNSPVGKTTEKTRYAEDAIDEIINRMRDSGIMKGDIEVCLVGGGNVLKLEDDTICQNIIDSIIKLLNERRIKIRAKALGGTLRRRVFLDVEKGIICFTEGDTGKKLLWKAEKD